MGSASCSHNSHSHKQSSPELTLNHGKKWQSDKHTMNSVNSMEKTISIKKNTNYISLKKNLDVELGVLIRGCTMEGKNHDALHIFLAKLIPLVELLKSDNMEKAKSAKKKIKKLLESYSDYFET